jgi:hypothetical protein
MTAPLAASAFAVVLLNLPFGYWRAGSARFARAWFFAMHAPVPFVVVIRLLAHLGWQAITFPVLVGAFFLAQFAGGFLHRCSGRDGDRCTGNGARD